MHEFIQALTFFPFLGALLFAVSNPRTRPLAQALANALQEELKKAFQLLLEEHPVAKALARKLQVTLQGWLEEVEVEEPEVVVEQEPSPEPEPEVEVEEPEVDEESSPEPEPEMEPETVEVKELPLPMLAPKPARPALAPKPEGGINFKKSLPWLFLAAKMAVNERILDALIPGKKCLGVALKVASIPTPPKGMKRMEAITALIQNGADNRIVNSFYRETFPAEDDRWMLDMPAEFFQGKRPTPVLSGWWFEGFTLATKATEAWRKVPTWKVWG